MKNALSIDVEDWFCVHNLSRVIRKDQWDSCEQRVGQSLLKVLNILDEKKVKATFFILGWVAQRYPEIVREIDLRGHEIATHGFSHTLLTQLSPDQFDKELKMSIEIIRRDTSQDILGHRAPSFSITEKTSWAFEILKKNGIKYDSSVFPVGFHPDYGMTCDQLGPHKISEQLWEFPLSVVKVLGKRIPVCGGAYFRIFPYFLISSGIKKINREGRPVVFYLHPWELDPNQPKVKLPLFKRFRHYCNLDKTEERLKMLLGEFEFTTISEVLNLWEKK